MFPERERGFILISAIWMLVLAGSLAAILVLRGVGSAKRTAAEGAILRSEMAALGAIDLVVADALFGGPRSRWWSLPARGVVQVGGTTVTVAVSSEASRFDLNSADLKLLDDQLRAAGYQSARRAAFIAEIAARRTTASRFSSFDDVRGMQSRAGLAVRDGRNCLPDMFTLYSGYSAPPSEIGSVPFISDAAVRIEVSAAGAPPIMAIIRAGVAGRSYDIMEWRQGQSCE